MNPEEVTRLAREYVEAYLEGAPEYTDVVEYVAENIDDEDDINDDLLAEIYRRVNAELDTIAQRYGDEER